MSDLSLDDPLQQLWQRNTPDLPRVSPQFVRQLVRDLNRRVWRRNAFEYTMGTLGLVAGSWFIWNPPYPVPMPVVRLGWALFVVAAIMAVFWWRRQAGARDLHGNAGALDALTFYRQELSRQLDARRKAWKVSLFFLPGALAVLAGTLTDFYPIPWFAFWFGIAWSMLVFACVWLINRRSATKLRQEIDALDSMR